MRYEVVVDIKMEGKASKLMLTYPMVAVLDY